MWNLRVNDRLAAWKDFRHELSDLPLDKAVTTLNQFWSPAPVVNYYLTSDTVKDWPDPWTLIAENYYCDVAKALGMLYTIYFTSHKSVPMDYRVYYEPGTKDKINVAYIDKGKYILNYYPYEIVNTQYVEQKQLKLLYQYSTTDLQLEKY